MKLDGVTIFSRTMARTTAFFRLRRGRALYNMPQQNLSEATNVPACEQTSKTLLDEKDPTNIFSIDMGTLGFNILLFPVDSPSPTCGTHTSSLLFFVTAGASPVVGSNDEASTLFMVLSTGSSFGTAVLALGGATAENAPTDSVESDRTHKADAKNFIFKLISIRSSQV
jgi:hypothetical protein